MSKVLLLTDTHYGIRNDNKVILDFQKKFVDEVILPTLENEKITEIFHLGDLVDRRKFINIQTHNRMRVDFLDPLAARNIRMTILAGNHDIYYKNSLKVNSLKEFVHHYPNIHVVEEPEEHPYGILLLPWICEENYEEVMTAVSKSNSPTLFGHLELCGYEMEKGRFADHGLSANLFEKFSCVCSGHFHHKSDYQNIHYLGSPWETNWGDYGDTRGFHIFDTNTQELRFIENRFKILKKVKYTDLDQSFDDIMGIDFSEFAGTYVKVIVRSKINPFWFDTFISKIEEAGAIDVKTVDDHLNLNIESADDIMEGAETTMDIIDKSIEATNLDDDKKKRLHSVIKQLHDDAVMLQS